MEYAEIKKLLNEPETVAEGLAQLDIYVSALNDNINNLTESNSKYKDTNANLAMLVSKPTPTEQPAEVTEEQQRREKFDKFVETL